MERKQAVRTFYDVVWNRFDKAVVPTLFHDDWTFRASLGPVRRGHQGFWDYMDEIAAALSGFTCEIRDLVEEGEQVFARMHFHGTHTGPFFGYAPTGKRVAWAGAALFTFSGGKIRDLWVLGDVHALLAELKANAQG